MNGTIAVIAGGIDNIYPPENKKLFEEIAENGLIIAENPYGTPPTAKSFPQRNRIISGLCMSTVIMEANLKSGGTLNTQLRHMRIFFSIINRCQKVQHFSWPIIQFPFNFFEHHFVNIIKFCSFWYVLSY